MKSSSIKHLNGYTMLKCTKTVALAVCTLIRAMNPVPFNHIDRDSSGVTGITVKLRLDATKQLLKSS